MSVFNSKYAMAQRSKRQLTSPTYKQARNASLGVFKYTAQQVALVCEHYPTATPVAEIALLCDLTEKQVRNIATMHKLKRPKTT